MAILRTEYYATYHKNINSLEVQEKINILLTMVKVDYENIKLYISYISSFYVNSRSGFAQFSEALVSRLHELHLQKSVL